LEQSKNANDSYTQLLNVSRFLSVQTDGKTIFGPDGIEFIDYDGTKKNG